MASQSRRIRRERKSSNADVLSFYMIIVNPLDKKLRLPKDFTRQLGRSFPSRVTLKTPNGSTWEAELIRSDGDTWIKKGWKEFKDYHSMGLGHLLMFEYDWISNFDVTIFDLTTVEIDYPVDQEGSETDDSDVFVKEKWMGQRKGQKGSAAYEMAETFKSDNPFCIIEMHPSYVLRPFSLNLPISFARKNLTPGHNEIQVRVSKGKKTWPVVCNFKDGMAAKIAGGWTSFVEENALKVGDACIFEVMNRKKKEWNVIIFRC